MKNIDGGFDVKNFCYTYGLFRSKHSMESKLTEHGIILLHKNKVEQTKVISRFSYFFHG